MLIYNGPSALDGKPIVAIVTGLDKASRNAKTGAMAQLWILPAEIHPSVAAREGADSSVCGDCKLRPANKADRPAGLKPCYVDLAKAPAAVYRAFKAGSYRTATPEEAGALASAKGRSIRLGAYGDPAALPVAILEGLTAGNRFTGYTHQWRRPGVALQAFAMASVDSPGEYALAKRLGYRAFVVVPRLDVATSLVADRKAVICPASKEGGERTDCASCGLCAGLASLSPRDVAIVAH